MPSFSDGAAAPATEFTLQPVHDVQALLEDVAALKASVVQQAAINHAVTTENRSLADQNQAQRDEIKTLAQEVRTLKLKFQSLEPLSSVSGPPMRAQQDTARPAAPSSTRRPRHLVVCIDGTSNQFSHKNTNVVELYHRLVKDDSQLTFYNSGIGTYATPSWKSVKYYKQVLDNKIDLAIAWNFDNILLSAYRWLSENYEDGDLIFLFGFSRGAYQIRTLAAMIDSVGLIRKGNLDQIPFAYELYAETKKFAKVTTSGSQPKVTLPDLAVEPDSTMPARSGTNTNVTELATSEKRHAPKTRKEGDLKEMCRRFKETFSRKEFKVYFAGAWDTVSSVGFIRDKTLPGTTDGMRHVTYFRHALALHERRVKFLHENVQGGLGPTSGATRPGENGRPPHTKEVWFAGSHGDIGGGAVSNLAMNQFGPALRWMLFEAAVAGLRLNDAPQQWENEKIPEIHNSLTGVWRVFEYIPFTRLSYKDGNSTTFRLHRGRPRKVQPGQLIHATALQVTSGTSWRARLPQNVTWDQLLERGMVEVDPYADAKDLITQMKEHLLSSPDQLLGEHNVRALKLLMSTKPGIRSLRDAPDAEKTMMAAMALYQTDNSVQDASNIVADAALAVLDLDAAELNQHIYYPTAQVSPIIARAQQRDPHLAERLETLFAPAQVQRPLEHPGDVDCVAYARDGYRIFSGCDDGAIRVWDLGTGDIIGTPMTGHTGAVLEVAVSTDGVHIASGSKDYTIRVWNILNEGTDSLLQGHNDWVRSVAFSPDGSRLASSSDDKSILVWDLASAKIVVGPIQGHSHGVCSISYSPDGLYIVSGSYDSTVRLWNADTGENKWQTKISSEVFSVAYSPDGTRIVVGSEDGSVRMLDAATGEIILGPLTGHTNAVESLTFSPDGVKFVSGSYDGFIRLWDTETGRELDLLRGHRSYVWSVAFSPDGKYVASASSDNTMRVWDATDDWKRQ